MRPRHRSPEEERAKDQSRVARRLVAELAPYRRLVALTGMWTIVAAAAQAASPALMGRAIDGPIMDGDPEGLLLLSGVLLLTYLIGAVSSREQVRSVGVIAQNVLADLRARLFAHFQRLPLGFFSRSPVGDLVSRVSSDVDTINQFMSQGVGQSLGQIFGLLGTIVAMLLLDWELALVSFIIIPILAIASTFFARRSREAYRVARQATGNVTAELQEQISGIREAQAYNRMTENIRAFRAENRANRDANVSAVRITASFAPAVDLLSTLGLAIVLAYGGWRVYHGDLTVGLLTAFILYVQQFFRPIQFLSQFYTQAQLALAGAERIYAILDEPAEPADAPTAMELHDVRGDLTFDHVTFGYDPARPVLHDISFHAAAGQTVAIVGPTGAGKSTLVNLIPRFYDLLPGNGRILLDNINIQQVTKESLRAQIAMVLQEPFLFAGTIAENIAYGRPGATHAEIVAAATAVQADRFIAETPAGYDTVLTEGGGGLSEGQRQLLAFARAVLADPRILILDEATSRIDTRTEALIQAALETLLRDRTSLVIAHRLSTIRNADLILVLDQGRIIEQGTHDELVELGGLYATLYRRQVADPHQALTETTPSVSASSA